MNYDLTEMLGFARPAGNVYEEAFIDKYIRSVNGIEEDAYGNLIVDVGHFPLVLWSSHTDTVANRGGMQEVLNIKGKLQLTFGDKMAGKKRRPSCLGADCTTGVWIMLNMIKEGRPGRYIFHRNEENGGWGSDFIAKKRPDLLQGVNHAIAFDRKGYHDVITHQSWQRTASDKFADALAQKLGMGYRKSEHGMFTDTDNYKRIVPECTNISVGYDRQHTIDEIQDLDFAKKLLDKLLSTDFQDLPTVRDPSVYQYRGAYTSSNSYGAFNGYTAYQQFLRMNADYIDEMLTDMGIDEDIVRLYVAKQKGKVTNKDLYDMQ